MPIIVTSLALYYINTALGRDFIYYRFKFKYYFYFKAGGLFYSH
jgi:hypothetical protein